MKKRSFALCMAVLMLVGVLAACGNNAGTTTAPAGSGGSTTAPATSGGGSTTAPANTTAAPVNTEPKIFMNWTTVRATWSPHQISSRGTLAICSTMVGIVSSVDGSDQLEFVPHDASELPYSTDGGYTWTIKFREGRTFDNGEPIDAEIYEYSMKMQIDPVLANKAAAFLFDPCVVVNARDYFQGNCDWEDVGIKVLDKYTMEIKLQYPATEIDFWTNIGVLISPVAKELYEKGMNADRTTTTYGTSFDQIAASGPWHLKEWVLDGYEILSRNEDNPLVEMGYYFMDEINTRYQSQTATLWQMFQNGELDWAALSGDNYEENKNDPRGVKSISSSVWGIFVNGESKNEIMQNNDFRLALYYSTPRVEIATQVYVLYDSPNYIISTGISVTDSKGVTMPYRETPAAKAIVEKFKDDDAKSLELFNKAYEANGNKKITIELTYFDQQEEMKRLGEVCQEKWENLFGADRFELKLRAVMPQQAYDNYRIGDYDLGTGVRIANVFNMWSAMVFWTSDYADPYLSGFYNEEYDRLYFDCMYGDLLFKPDERIAALAKMEEMLMDYCVFLPAMQNNNTWIVNERILLPTYTYLPWVSYGFFQSDLIPS